MDQLLLERMLEISSRMASTRELEPLLTYAMQEALTLVNAENGYIVLLDDDGNYEFAVHQTRAGSEIESPEEQISHSILRDVLTSHKPEIVSDALTDPQHSDAKSVQALQVRSVMCVPLVTPDRTIGAIYVENRQRADLFNRNQLQPLTFFANQAAVSIENTLLINHLEERVAQRTAEVEQSWRETVEANRIRNEMLSTLAHDIRAPMGVVMGALSMMENRLLGQLTDEQEEWVSKAIEATRHMKHLTSDLLDFSKMQLRGIVLEPKPVDMREFLQRTYNIALGFPWDEHVQFQLELAAGDLPVIACDRVRIQQVLFNLLNNALKFTQRGTVKLYCRPVPNRDAVLIGVSDTGEGIPPDQMDRIFDRFYQSDENETRRHQGSGLGLAISRELVEMHGGRIWVQANPEGGSNFMFTLPTKPVNDQMPENSQTIHERE